MRNSKVVVTSVVVSSVLAAGCIAAPAFAWHPQGQIIKYVQNQTTGSALSDANTAATAVAAKPGDTLKYVINVKNAGAADSRGYNDMAKTVMTDTLPAGVELVSNPSTRTITENLGLIKPGQTVSKEYLVKVTASKNGTIENKACFTGNSTANDNPQSGCDAADVKVTVPETPVTPPVTPETPATSETPAPEVPTELPSTGPTDFIVPAVVLGAVTYLGVLLARRHA
ncbi:MAG TPA: hypothetical protein VH144_03530 [Candidatus Saccharimonadales bacterium]|nr:hypothetical protein [Candidatus Saccharimonadales bacterium]